jgi:HlyD family type I secretion membrane fusion protein
LASTAATNDLSQLRSRAATLTLAKQRHTALLRQQTLNLMPPEGTDPNLVADQHQLFDAQRSLRIHEEQTLQSRIAQRESDLTVRELEIQSLARQMVISLDQLDTAEALFKKKLTARAALQTARSTHEQLVAREVAAIGRRNAARTALDEAKAVYLEAQVQAHTRHSEQLTKVSAELAELGHEIEKLTDRVDRLAVRSPVRGIIQHLPFRSAGAVIKPGEIVAKVVPSDEQLVAEVQLDPKDIGHVSLGDLAEIKVSTFDPNVFGVVPGHVARLSASSFQTERGDAYFKATIALSQNHVGQGKSQQNIRPGMTIQADIITGSKSLVKYMLKPVYRSLDSAFSER